jgi:hypothetical protein
MFPLDPLVVSSLSLPASLTRVAKESASIFRMMFPRWIWKAYSAIPDASLVVHDIDKLIRRFHEESGLIEMKLRAMCEDAIEFLAKPFDHHLLLKRVRDALAM